MSRAELRRQKRENVKKAKTFIMTAEELEKIRMQEFNRAKKLLLDKNDDLAEQILQMMLVIPTNVLIADYWPKSAKQRIPEFVESCMSLYQAWERGVVTMTEMQELTEEYAGIKLIGKGTATDKAMKERVERGID